MHKKTKRTNPKRLILGVMSKQKVVEFILGFLSTLLATIIGALFNLWLTKTYGYSLMGG